MDETRGGDAPRDDEPSGEPRRPGGQEPPPAAPQSNFPTFGRTPGWEHEPDPYAETQRQPRDPSWDQSYGQPAHGRQTYEQQGYNQGYGYPGYSYEQPHPPAPYSGYGGYGGYGPTYATETETGAIVALILAILSWVACPVVLAIPALIVASNSRAKIRSFPERYGGLGLITAARVVAWLNIGLFVVVILFGLVASIVSAGSGG